MRRSRHPRRHATAVQRFAGHVLVEPAAEWLSPFGCYKLSGAPSGRYGHQLVKDSVSLFRLSRRSGQLVAQLWRGLQQPVVGALKVHGFPVELKQPQLDTLPVSVDDKSVDRGMIDFIAGREVGLIRPDRARNVDLPSLVGQIAIAFPTARIVVIVPDRTHAWADGIRQWHRDVGESTFENPYFGVDRIVVSTLGALGTVGLDRAEIVLVAAPWVRIWEDPLLQVVSDEPPAPGSRYRVQLLDRLIDVRRRLFGFLDRHYRPSPFEAARLAQMFGLDEYVVPAHGLTERSVRVIWEPLRGGPIPSIHASELETKRSTIWTNPLLLRRAANLARALATGDMPLLSDRYSGVAAAVAGRESSRVLVLVEGLTQAEILAERLPGWPTLNGRESALSVVSDLCTGVIATALGVESLRSDDYDIVIRLDMGTGLPPVPLPRWLETADSQSRPLLVVDWDCRAGTFHRRRRDGRRSAYLAAGWCDFGDDPDVAAFQRFMARLYPRRNSR